MSRFLLDTGTANDYANRRHEIYERARQEVARGNKIGIAIPVLAELHYGVEFGATRERNRQSKTTLNGLSINPPFHGILDSFLGNCVVQEVHP